MNTFKYTNRAHIVFGLAILFLTTLVLCFTASRHIKLSPGSVILNVCMIGLTIYSLAMTKKMRAIIDKENQKIYFQRGNLFNDNQESISLSFSDITDLKVSRRIEGLQTFQKVSYSIKFFLSRQLGFLSPRRLVG